MHLTRLLPRATLFAAVLLASGCAHQATVRETPPTVTITETAEADAPIAADTVAATGETAPPADATTAPTDATDAPALAGAPLPDAPTEGLPAAIADGTTTDPVALAQDPEAGVYDPIADPTLPEPVALPTAYDPWEKYNRRMHRLNDAVDRRVAKPLATAYVRVVPRPVRLGVGNFFHNLGQPVSALNALLQGKPKQAGQSVGRFLLNATLGIGGLFDPATSAKIPNRSEDFGQTLGVWGWKKSRYVELPLFGPRTVRDVFGMAGDAPLSPIRPIEEDKLRIFLQGLQLVDVRTQVLSVDHMREGATDDYALLRDAWLQRRNYQIFGDRESDDDASLPDYLLEEESNPTVPIDAMPMPETP
jgi:phospholipid-binding lipoprotein MlaA